MRLKQLREQAAQQVTAMREIDGKATAEKRAMTAEERQAWDRVNKEYDRLCDEIRREERLAALEREQGQGAGDRTIGREDTPTRDEWRRDHIAATEEQRTTALRSWAKRQYGRPLTEQEQRVCQSLRFDPSVSELQIGLLKDRQRNQIKAQMRSMHYRDHGNLVDREVRGLATQFGDQGGYLRSPGSLSAAFELNLLAFGGVRQVAQEITTQSGEDYYWPNVDDTGNKGEQLGEATTIGTNVQPLIGMQRWGAFKFSSRPVFISSELLEDDQYDLASTLGEMLGTRLGRITAERFATGSGAGTAEGIVTGSKLGVTAAAATKFTFDEVVELIHSVDPAYRSMPGVGFLLHDKIVSFLRRLKDGEGRYIWQSGVTDGRPDSLYGYPVGICQEMDSSLVSGAKPLLFGSLGHYKIRKVRDVRMYRLVERYRDIDQDGFVAFIREDGKLLQSNTPPVRHLLMP